MNAVVPKLEDGKGETGTVILGGKEERRVCDMLLILLVQLSVILVLIHTNVVPYVPSLMD